MLIIFGRWTRGVERLTCMFCGNASLWAHQLIIYRSAVLRIIAELENGDSPSKVSGLIDPYGCA